MKIVKRKDKDKTIEKTFVNRNNRSISYRHKINYSKFYLDQNSLNTDKEHIDKNIKDILDPLRPILNIEAIIIEKMPIEKWIKITNKIKNREICLFSECYCINITKRSEFDNKIINHEKIQKTKNLNYMGFASGNLYSDLRLLSGIITKNKETKIKNIHLIDICYDYLNYIRSIQLAQFVKLLSEIQGQTINLMVHANLESYIDLCSINKDLKANLATILDFNTRENGCGWGSDPSIPWIDGISSPNRNVVIYGQDQQSFQKKIVYSWNEIIDAILNNGLKKDGLLCVLGNSGEYQKIFIKE